MKKLATNKTFNNTKITRRTFLKGVGAITVTASGICFGVRQFFGMG
jgi:hypothetical protein